MIGPYTLTFAGQTWHDVTIDVGAYDDGGSVALIAVNDDGPICDITVNPASLGVVASPGCLLVKNHSENAGLLDELARLGLLVPTGVTHPSGLVELPEARAAGPLAEAITANAGAEA